MATAPCFAVRGKGNDFITVKQWNSKEVDAKDVFRESATCAVMKFSCDGSLFAYCNSKDVIILSTKTWKTVGSLPLPRTSGLQFSPDGKYLCTFELYRTQPNGQDASNLKIFNVETWVCVFSYIQKKMVGWQPSWNNDSTICGRLMTNNVFFYENAQFDQPKHKLNIEKLSDFSFSPNNRPPYRVACFVSGVKGSPSSVRLFHYPNFESHAQLCNKSFFNVDTVAFLWNKNGTAVLAKVMTDVDTSGESYYGGQNLYFLNYKGDSAHIQLSKKGPLYNVAWNPKGTSFCVIFGYMPALASIFNDKAELLYTFKQSPKNCIHFNPHGNILVMAGFGNLRGTIEVWDYENRKQLSAFEASDTTWFEWCPDGEHFITATTSPRLRVNNGYKIWHYTGKLLANVPWSNDLYEATWQSFLPDYFPVPVINKDLKLNTAAFAMNKPKSYVPPHARGRTDYNPKLEDEEEKEDKEEKQLSKAALKNKRKREAKKQSQTTESNAFSNEQNDAISMASYLLGKNTNDISTAKSSAPSENDKKIKALNKKLQAIEKLKNQQREGKVLEKNQLEKISMEESLRKDLEKLQC